MNRISRVLVRGVLVATAAGSGHALVAEARRAAPLESDHVFTRGRGADWLHPIADTFEVPTAEIVAALRA